MQLQAFFDRHADRLGKLYPNSDYRTRYAQLYASFVDTFHAEPEAFVSAPGRTEISGNHTDHNKGAVLAAAIDLDTVAAVKKNATMTVTLYSAGYEKPFIVDLTDLTIHEEQFGTTFALIRGVAAKLAEMGYVIGGFDAMVTSSVFSGSGLSSSAAFEVMLTALFTHLFDNPVLPAIEQAKVSQFAENVFFGKPSGLLDQAASATGGLVTMDFGTDPIESRAIAYDFSQKGYALCVVACGGDHGNLTDCYAAIPAEMKQVAKALGSEMLYTVEPDELFKHLPELKGMVPDRAILRAFHFVDETRRAKAAAVALEQDVLDTFFAAINASGESSWKLLQNLYVPASDNQEIPLALEMSRRTLEGKGAWRIHGGGFAGTILSFVPRDMLDAYKQAMNGVFGDKAVTVLNVRPEGAVYLQ